MKLLDYIICIILMYLGCWGFVLMTGADNNVLCIGFIIVMVGMPILKGLADIIKLWENKNND